MALNYKYSEEEPRLKGTLILTVNSCKNLRDVETFGKQDPYVTLKIGDEKFKSKVMENAGVNPVFEQAFLFNLRGDQKLVDITVRDQEVTVDRDIARACIPLRDLVLARGQMARYQLLHPSNFREMAGDIYMTAQFTGTGGPLEAEKEREAAAKKAEDEKKQSLLQQAQEAQKKADAAAAAANAAAAADRAAAQKRAAEAQAAAHKAQQAALAQQQAQLAEAHKHEAAARARADQLAAEQRAAEEKASRERGPACRRGHQLRSVPATPYPPGYEAGWMRCDECHAFMALDRFRVPFFHCDAPECNQYDVCPNCQPHLNEVFVLAENQVMLQPRALLPPEGGDAPLAVVLWHDLNTWRESETYGWLKAEPKTPGAKLAYHADDKQGYGFYSQIEPAAQGDSFTYYFQLPAGTYTMGVFGIRSSASGILRWELDGHRVGKDQDWYVGSLSSGKSAPAPAPTMTAAGGKAPTPAAPKVETPMVMLRNEMRTVANGIVVADPPGPRDADGSTPRHTLRCTVVGKHMSSHSFYAALTRIQFWPE